jgi:hypothetical protein
VAILAKFKLDREEFSKKKKKESDCIMVSLKIARCMHHFASYNIEM